METTINSIKTHLSSETKNFSKQNSISFWETLEFNRFGIISMLVVVLGCIGGIAASYGAGDNALKLAMIAFPTIISLALILAVAPMRIITYLSAIAIILDILVFVF